MFSCSSCYFLILYFIALLVTFCFLFFLSFVVFCSSSCSFFGFLFLWVSCSFINILYVFIVLLVTFISLVGFLFFVIFCALLTRRLSAVHGNPDTSTTSSISHLGPSIKRDVGSIHTRGIWEPSHLYCEECNWFGHSFNVLFYLSREEGRYPAHEQQLDESRFSAEEDCADALRNPLEW
jgi:hypothetical protein